MITTKRGSKLLEKKTALLGLLVLTAVFLSGIAVGQQTEMYCAEKTTYGAWCQNVPLEEVDTNYRYDRTSCESTSYCSEGTCVNTLTGECLPGPQATCDSSQGGYFYSAPEDEVAQCQIGCCLLGDQAALVEQVRCDALGTDYNLQTTFRSDIQDELTCLSLASPEAEGACVFETSEGRDCDATTRGECQESAGEFHEGFLCTAPELGTICTRTTLTTCVEGRNEVYFIDSCGNLANVYDANKIDDIAYWSYLPGIQGVEIDEGHGGNAGSAIYGYCSYIKGSTCRKYDRTIDPRSPKYGNYICRTLDCPASSDPLTGGVRRKHGEEWCSEPIENFERAEPGKVSYLLYCYDGEVYYEICDYYRNKLCLEDEETGAAGCIVNNWMPCININSTKECEDAEDCKVVKGASLLRTEYGTEKKIKDSNTGDMINAVCAPKYTPGFKFWDSNGTILDEYDKNPSSICEFASVNCFVPYTQEVSYITKWRAGPSDECVDRCKEIEKDWSSAECYKECTPICLEDTLEDKKADAKIMEDWAESWQELCVSLGDCGVSGNWLDVEGYNRWRDLFLGEQIDWDTLPNADNKK